MHRILVATDFSTRSDRALRRALLLARQSSAKLVLLHVVDDDQPTQMVEAQRDESTNLLEELTQTARADGIGCEFSVVLGDPFERIALAAEELRADLVLLGPHRRQILRDIFVGTTAERIIRTSGRPVLMVNGFPTSLHRTVVIAMDFTPYSATAARAARQLGLLEHGEPIALHVIEDATGPLARASIPMQELRVREMQEEETAHAKLAQIVAEAGVGASLRVVRSNEESTSMAINNWAQRLSADLVVVGTHGRSGLEKWLLGSVAECVLAHSTIDVLAVPPDSAIDDVSPKASAT